MDRLDKMVLDSNKIKQLVDYLAKEANGNHTEFRVVIYENGTGYAHVMNRDSTSLNFELPRFFKQKCDECNGSGKWKENEQDKEITCPKCNGLKII